MLQPHETIQHHHVKFHRDKWTALTNKNYIEVEFEKPRKQQHFFPMDRKRFIGSKSRSPSAHPSSRRPFSGAPWQAERRFKILLFYHFDICFMFKILFLEKNVCQVDAKYWNIHVISSETIQKVSKPQRCGSCPFQRVSILFFQVRELTSFLLFREFWFSVPFEKFGCPFHFR